MEKKTEKKYMKVFLLLFLGVVLRYWCMSIGHNYDFESYCIVGDLAGHYRNVYAETTRYNYGPVFFCILGLLYRFSYFLSTDPELTYRILIVSLLTLTDLGITFYIANQNDTRCAVCFFLNPISVIITGYHNQFDNMAILLALYGLHFYNENEKLGKKDGLFVLFMSLSLMTKHIFFLIPVFIILKRGLPLKKKMIYTMVPPCAFLISFVPFALCSKEAFRGIAGNVFLYRSYNNAPLLYGVFELVDLSDHLYIYVYGIIMCVVGFVVRKREFGECIMLYLISMVAFASAITNQYLAIPMAALYVLKLGIVKYFYMITMLIFLYLNGAGFQQLSAIIERYPAAKEAIIRYEASGYTVAAWILFIALVYEIILERYLRRN